MSSNSPEQNEAAVSTAITSIAAIKGLLAELDDPSTAATKLLEIQAIAGAAISAGVSGDLLAQIEKLVQKAVAQQQETIEAMTIEAMKVEFEQFTAKAEDQDPAQSAEEFLNTDLVKQTNILTDQLGIGTIEDTIVEITSNDIKQLKENARAVVAMSKEVVKGWEKTIVELQNTIHNDPEQEQAKQQQIAEMRNAIDTCKKCETVVAKDEVHQQISNLHEDDGIGHIQKKVLKQKNYHEEHANQERARAEELRKQYLAEKEQIVSALDNVNINPQQESRIAKDEVQKQISNLHEDDGIGHIQNKVLRKTENHKGLAAREEARIESFKAQYKADKATSFDCIDPAAPLCPSHTPVVNNKGQGLER
jgi:hypothetical protein